MRELPIDELKLEIKRLEGKRHADSNIDELQDHYQELTDRLQGTRVRCVVARDDIMLRVGQEFDFVAIEAGIFDTPYVTVRKLDGKLLTGHQYRFETILDDNSTERIMPSRWFQQENNRR
jgi:hypothetical protein